jgi:hypothetical protein
MQVIKHFIKRNFSGWVNRHQLQAARKIEIEKWQQQFQYAPPVALSDTSFDVFTYHGEDGILLYLINNLPNLPTTFIDIGAGDCVKSNCANLAVHFGWAGIFFDKNREQLSIGKSFYKNRGANTGTIRFAEAEVTAENINELITENCSDSKIGLLSVDIDGNDYWIWKAINVIQPEIVVIEAKVEFGQQSIVVPYGKQNHHSVDIKYNGASVEALQKLGAAKGYKLVGANKQGYNLFFVKQYRNLPATTAAAVLNNQETINSFYPASFFSTHTFEIV